MLVAEDNLFHLKNVMQWMDVLRGPSWPRKESMKEIIIHVEHSCQVRSLLTCILQKINRKYKSRKNLSTIYSVTKNEFPPLHSWLFNPLSRSGYVTVKDNILSILDHF